MAYIQGTISVNGIPRNGATANLYLASIFPTPPTFNTPLPPNPIATVKTGKTYGGDGAYLFTVGSFGEWWVGVDWNGTILWEYHTFGTTTVTTVNIESYGAHSIDDLGYSTFDSAPAINSAIAALIAANGGQGQVIIPRKRYRIDSPILMARITGGNTWNFGSMTLRGDDSSAKDNPGQAAILPSYNSDPAIVVQWGRNVRLKDFIVTGLNDTSATLGGTSYDNLLVDANFVTAGCRDNRYSPYCAIAVDPFKNTVGSSDRYPISDGLGYYDYLPHTNDGTSGLQIENVTARYFVVGFNLSSAPNVQQGDIFVLRDCKATNNKVGIAIGQSQDRGISIEGGAYSWQKYFVSCSQYGQRTGPPPNVFGAVASATKYLLEYDAAQGTASWSGFYCESTLSIGCIGKSGASTAEAFAFNGCQFNFHNSALRPDFHLKAEADVTFNGCYLNTSELPLSIWSDANSPRPVTFRNTHFQLNTTKQAVDNFGTWNPFQGMQQFDDCSFSDSGSFGGPSGPGVSQVSRLRHTLSPSYNGHDRALVAPAAQFRYQQGTLFGNNAVNQIQVADGALGIVALTPSSGVAVTPDGLGGATFTGTQNGDLARVGDHVHAFNAVLIPDAPDGGPSSAVANILIGRISAISGPATAPVVTLDSCPQCLSGTPTLDCRVVFMKRFHQPSVGDVTSGSATVANVALAAGGSVSNSWQAGHRIQGLGIALGTYLTAVSGTDLTLSRPATATTAGTPLYNADMGVIAPNRWAAVGTSTWNPPSLTSGSAATTTIAVAGATIGDFVTASFSNSLQGMQLTGYVDSAGSVTVVLFNSTAGTLDLASGTLLVNLTRF